MVKLSPQKAMVTSLACFTLCLLSGFMLVSYNTLEYLGIQLYNDYKVIYLDSRYFGLIGASFGLLSAGLFMLWQYICLKRFDLSLGPKHLSTKAFAVAAVIGFLFIFPGQSIEKSRIEKIAEQHGYQACPPFTLLMGSSTIDAWVKDFSLCNDPEVDKLAQYGYPDEPAQIAKLLADRKSK
jgi:hypothetical protein